MGRGAEVGTISKQKVRVSGAVAAERRQSERRQSERIPVSTVASLEELHVRIIGEAIMAMYADK